MSIATARSDYSRVGYWQDELFGWHSRWSSIERGHRWVLNGLTRIYSTRCMEHFPLRLGAYIGSPAGPKGGSSSWISIAALIKCARPLARQFPNSRPSKETIKRSALQVAEDHWPTEAGRSHTVPGCPQRQSAAPGGQPTTHRMGASGLIPLGLVSTPLCRVRKVHVRSRCRRIFRQSETVAGNAAVRGGRAVNFVERLQPLAFHLRVARDGKRCSMAVVRGLYEGVFSSPGIVIQARG